METPDLSLPPTCPPLGAFENYNMDDAAFALYTLVDLPPSSLSELTTLVNSEWITSPDVPPLVLLPDRYNFTGQPLRAVLDAHVALDKDITPRDDNPDVEGNLHWFPSAFIVVTDVDWATRGLLFVYLDDRDDEGEGLDAESRSLEKFFFRAQDAYPFLGSVSYGDSTLCQAKEEHAIE
ncbi:uncharacterized protein BDW47DRAFT_74987 [Aspergillus candidus]|uniref:Uncharacterized protein n=1 Tax=Aspergillus candidus TaxID=41067 RepID=A0A2I2FKA4_ASPCN|nr:hypothetical protein BDW47DRAFT_74987 [Aspergillus candidus]PLB41068.1 hypothetical protein BDW47DRAFT_74987 [Aspergillus candidus]